MDAICSIFRWGERYCGDQRPRQRYGEEFLAGPSWAWKHSNLNQREYCEIPGLAQKAFENWRQKFQAESQPPERKLLYRRGGHLVAPVMALVI